MATIAAAIHLFRPRYRLATAAVGGVLAGAATALLEVQGVPSVVSPVATAPLVIVPVWLARTRSSFAPERLCEEGMLAVSVLGVAVAVLPGVLDGWQAATNLSAAAERPPSADVPAWTFALLVTSSSLGALYALWSRR